MRHLFFVLFTIICSTSYAQLTIDLAANTGANFTIESRNIHPESSAQAIKTRYHASGTNIGASIGASYFAFNRHFSVSTGIGYLFRIHESSSSPIASSAYSIRHPEHFLTVPLDIAYHFNFGLGLHIGMESAWLMTSERPHETWDIRKQVVISPMAGVSYRFKRFRFMLLSKHAVQNLYTEKYNNNIKGEENTDYINYRYHDLELKVVFNLYEFKF